MYVVLLLVYVCTVLYSYPIVANYEIIVERKRFGFY